MSERHVGRTVPAKKNEIGTATRRLGGSITTTTKDTLVSSALPPPPALTRPKPSGTKQRAQTVGSTRTMAHARSFTPRFQRSSSDLIVAVVSTAGSDRCRHHHQSKNNPTLETGGILYMHASWHRPSLRKATHANPATTNGLKNAQNATRPACLPPPPNPKSPSRYSKYSHAR